MRGLRGEAGPFDLSSRRRIISNLDRLVWLFLYRGPILLVAGVHTSPKHARVYLRHQTVVVRPRFYPIRKTLRPLHLTINRNLHCSDQLPHASLHLFLPSGRGESFRAIASRVSLLPLVVLVVAAPPDAGFVAPQRRAVKPLVHAP